MLAYSVEKQGNALTLTCSDGRTLTTNKWDEVACFLLMPSQFSLVWNIDTFVDDITSTMSADVRNKVLKGGRVYSPDNRKLYYQPSRVFSINQINIYGLSRYNEEKIDDVVELSKLGDKVLQAYKQFGIEATKLSSPVAVFSEILEATPFPRACDLPDDAFDMIQVCAKVMTREWRDLYKIGHWAADEITDYDLTNAYGSLVAKLPDITHAKFFRSKTMPERFSWGELYGKLKIVKPVSPFFYQPKNCYPIGEWEDSITTDQLWLLNKYGIGEFEMEYGNFFTLPSYYRFPFKAIMERLYQLRSSNDKLVAKIAKGISVGIWGKFAEIHEGNKLGDHFNSIYARMTTSRCGVKVADFVYRNHMETDCVSILVDGVLATKRIEINNSRVMGQWRMNEPMPALVLSLLYQWQGDKKPNGKYYNEMIAMIKDKPNSPVYADVDLNLLTHSRNFSELPKCGGDLLKNKYNSELVVMAGI